MSVFQHTSDPIQPESVAETMLPRVLTLDFARYEAMLDDPDLSEEQRLEFLETLWSIIVSFVDLGYGVHPMQQYNWGKQLDEQFYLPQTEAVRRANKETRDQKRSFTRTH